jgi:hypothetical protein
MSLTPVIPRLIVQDGDLTVHTYQDVEDIIEHNKKLKGERQTGDLRHIASIPNNILIQWLNEEWARGNVNMKLFDEEFNKLVARKLRDHDWLFLRTDK